MTDIRCQLSNVKGSGFRLQGSQVRSQWSGVTVRVSEVKGPGGRCQMIGTGVMRQV